jgi:hypothetical protein
MLDPFVPVKTERSIIATDAGRHNFTVEQRRGAFMPIRVILVPDSKAIDESESD